MKLTVVFSMIMLFGASSQAGVITISNAGFENPNVGSGAIVNAAPNGWNTSNFFAGTWNIAAGGFFTGSAPEGSQILFVGFDGSASDANQTLGATVAANTTYTLAYSLGQRNDRAFSTYSVALKANGVTILGSDSAGAPTSGNFVNRTITFSTGAAPATLGQTLGIYIQASGLSALGANAQAEFDNFSLTANPTASGTPEPATFGMIGAGIGAMAFARRRLQSKN